MKSEEILAEAIAQHKCITATYNGERLKLAPHVLYMHHDEYFLDAVTVERNGAAPKKIKVGIFKLTGLKNLIPDDQGFATLRKFTTYDATFKGTLIASV